MVSVHARPTGSCSPSDDAQMNLFKFRVRAFHLSVSFCQDGEIPPQNWDKADAAKAGVGATNVESCWCEL